MLQKKDLYLFYAISFFKACMFMIPVWYFFYTGYLNFWLSEAIFLAVFWWIIQAIFEVPSWAWADRIGRKKNYIIGTLLYFIAFPIFYVGSEFWHFIILWWIFGIANAISSWNIESIIHDKLWNQNGAEQQFNIIQSRQYTLLFLWRAISAFFAWYLFVYHPLLPISVTIACYLVAFFCVLCLSNNTQEISKAETNTVHIKEAAVWFMKNKKELYMMIMGWFVLTGIGNIYWYSYQVFLQEHSISIEHIWVVFSIIAVSSALWSYTIGKLQNTYSAFLILKYLFIILFFCALWFISFSWFFLLIPITLLAFIFGFMDPVVKSYIIRKAPKTHKSSIFSLFWLSVSFWFFSFSILASFFMEIYGVEIVYSAIILLILCIILLDQFYIRKKFLIQE